MSQKQLKVQTFPDMQTLDPVGLKSATKTADLTDLKCRKATPREKPYRIADRGGLGLLITPTGGKLWRWAYRFEGKMKQMALGKYPDVPLTEARIRHANARGQLANGIDPMAVRKQAKQEKKRVEEVQVEKPVGFTFEELTRQWFSWWKADKDPKYARNVETRLEGDIIPRLGKRAPADITRMELVTLTQEVALRARDIAKRNLQFVRQIYDFGMDRGLLDQNTVNPAASIRPENILNKVEEKHFPSLPIGQVPDLLRKMRDYNGNASTRIAMEIMALTFLRTSELIESLWSNIDWNEQVWRLTAEQMKKPRPHIVPLATQTLALLQRLHAITGKSDRLFPGMVKSATTMSNNTILQALKRMGYKGLMSGHGYRSVASTYLHEKGFVHEHIELQLSHAQDDKVSAAYNYANYLEQRRVMMQAWADALDQLREKSC